MEKGKKEGVRKVGQGRGVRYRMRDDERLGTKRRDKKQ